MLTKKQGLTKKFYKVKYFWDKEQRDKLRRGAPFLPKRELLGTILIICEGFYCKSESLPQRPLRSLRSIKVRTQQHAQQKLFANILVEIRMFVCIFNI